MALVKRIELKVSQQQIEIEKRGEWLKSIEIRLMSLIESRP